MHEQAKDFYISPGFLPPGCSLTLRDNEFLLSPKRINNKNRNASIYLFALIILTSNDCHPNPGPRPPKFPCNICSNACKWSKTVKSVACDNCDMWYHKHCLNMNTAVFDALENTDVSWYCCNCGIPQFNSSLFDEDPSTDNDTNDSLSSNISCIGPPLSQSSPTVKSGHRAQFRPITKRRLRVISVNFQSMKAKRESFWSLLEEANPDIILASETWLHPGIHDCEVLPDNYRFIARGDRPNDPHGGVAIIAHRELEGVQVNLPTDSEFVAASFTCKHSKKPLITGALYRPPSSDVEYMESLCSAISSLSNMYPGSVIWISGDANLPDIEWETTSIVDHHNPVQVNTLFINTVMDIASEQIVDFPTRGQNLLDIFVTNRPSLLNKCTPLPGLSDHDIVLVDSNITPARQKPPKRLIHLWKKTNIPDMEADLKNNLESAFSTYDTHTPVDTLWTTFKNTCLSNIQKHVPSKLSSSRYSQPWCNRSIRRLSRRKKRAFNRARRTGRQKDWDTYRHKQKETQKACKSACNTYINDMVNNDTGNKKLYSYIKSRRCESNGVSPLMKDGTLHGDSKTKAELLNSQFSSVFTTEDTTNFPDLGDSPYPTAPPIRVSEKGVVKLLHGLNPHKATGPDGLSTRFLKEMSAAVAPSLTLIYQASLDQGLVPDDWRNANVAPIFKKGDRSKASNYRPVSLTSVCSKLVEHIIHSHLMTYFEDNNTLTDYQHGFRKNRSCEAQLINTIQDLAAGMDKSTQIDAILLDFSKAFDKVSHQRLLRKLHHYGVRASTLRWIQSFLGDRTQRVVVDGESSTTAPVTSGVPQGTVLGPLLFLVYINDLPSRVKATARLFADDCLLYRTVNSSDDVASLQQDLDNLQEWEHAWQMHFNPDKCEVIHITRRRARIELPYFIHGKALSTTKSAKYLGVTICDNLSWNTHISTICRKASNTTAFLRRNLSSCPRKIKATSYTTFVRPQLEYSSSVWDPHTQANIQKLEGVQRRAARFVTGNHNPTDSVTAMIDELGWESLQTRRQRAKLTMMFRISHSLVAISQSPLQHLGAATRGHQQRYRIPYCRTSVYKESFFPSSIRLWNALPDNITAVDSLEAFKSRIQDYHPTQP